MQSKHIQLKRRYATSRRRVFDAWTRPRQLRQWAFGGEQRATRSVRIELYPGGAWELILRSGPGRSKRWGVFREVHAPDHLTFTWVTDAPGLEGVPTRVTLDIDGSESEATLTLTHAGLPEEEHETSRVEWTELLESLEDYLAREDSRGRLP